MSGRPSKYSEFKDMEARNKIPVGPILKRLYDIQEKIDDYWTDITPAQVAGLRLDADISLALLRKRFPDLKALEITGTIEHRLPEYQVIIEAPPSNASLTEPVPQPVVST